MADYTAIEDAVMETARGRWFLLEFARRQRAGEMLRLTESIDRLEAMMQAPVRQYPLAAEVPVVPMPVAAATIPFRSAIIEGPHAEIAERLLEIAWSMRERGFDDGLCDAIEMQARMVQSFRGADEASKENSASGQTKPDVEQQMPDEKIVHSTLAVTVEMRDEAQNDNRDFVAGDPNGKGGMATGFQIRKNTLEQRIAALSRLDELPVIEKLALFC